MRQNNMYIFIINPVAGSGKGSKVWELIKADLETENVYYRSFFTKHAGHAEDIALQIAELHGERLEAIIVVGGDGTMHEVINGLRSYPQIPVGYIPGGSGNDFARGFMVPRSVKKAWKRIYERKNKSARTFDLGRFRFSERKKAERFFINGLGIGFDGEVAKETNQSSYKKFLNKLRCGSLAYAISVIRLLFSYQPCDIHVEIDGNAHTFQKAWLVAISNIPYYGGGMKISPNARPDDGKLSLCVVHQLNKWKLLAVFITVFMGQHQRFKEVTLLEGKSLTISSERPLLVHADGEIIGKTPITINTDMRTQIII
ncbi:diacylglycerol/lipid kinase family protein [Bacillus horti]|uniref:YegS/Rv2252/BmrU family lipid kinase n=1 Tax=Caldalkalibacillus horti TaxID=77523 RepID=A0ABT9W5G6_9BACI|nr:diacylglycerol kinase family protein [Bacillus horti]MDQ0168317.1 YegS/Rv2252/BmrU family lipid kinase [Bacillus horti]